MITHKKIKLKKCKICKEGFKPFRTTDKICFNFFCKSEMVQQAKAKKAKKKAVSKKEPQRTLREKRAQYWFNRWIREVRDRFEPCISCGEYSETFHAGHYRSIGSALELRFNELNVHKQCETCNIDRGGDHVNYRKRLLIKIGPENLRHLEGPHPIPHRTIEDLQAIEDNYKLKVKGVL